MGSTCLRRDRRPAAGRREGGSAVLRGFFVVSRGWPSRPWTSTFDPPDTSSPGSAMPTEEPTVVLVHGAFAESASWNGVIERLHAHSVEVIAAANPLRSLSGDAAYLRDVLAGVGGPIVLVGHSYGGMVVTEAAAGNDAVRSEE